MHSSTFNSYTHAPHSSIISVFYQMMMILRQQLYTNNRTPRTTTTRLPAISCSCTAATHTQQHSSQGSVVRTQHRFSRSGSGESPHNIYRYIWSEAGQKKKHRHIIVPTPCRTHSCTGYTHTYCLQNIRTTHTGTPFPQQSPSSSYVLSPCLCFPELYVRRFLCQANCTNQNNNMCQV